MNKWDLAWETDRRARREGQWEDHKRKVSQRKVTSVKYAKNHGKKTRGTPSFSCSDYWLPFSFSWGGPVESPLFYRQISPWPPRLPHPTIHFLPQLNPGRVPSPPASYREVLQGRPLIRPHPNWSSQGPEPGLGISFLFWLTTTLCHGRWWAADTSATVRLFHLAKPLLRLSCHCCLLTASSLD